MKGDGPSGPFGWPAPRLHVPAPTGQACGRCHKPTAIRRSGLLVHADRGLDADHLPPGHDELRREAEERTAAIPPAYRDAGYAEMDPLEQRRMDGDR